MSETDYFVEGAWSILGLNREIADNYAFEIGSHVGALVIQAVDIGKPDEIVRIRERGRQMLEWKQP